MLYRFLFQKKPGYPQAPLNTKWLHLKDQRRFQIFLYFIPDFPDFGLFPRGILIGVVDAVFFGRAFARAGMDFLSLSRGGKFDDARKPRVGQAVYPYTGPSGYECMPTVISDEQGPFGRNVDPVAQIRAAVRDAAYDRNAARGSGSSYRGSFRSLIEERTRRGARRGALRRRSSRTKL